MTSTTFLATIIWMRFIKRRLLKTLCLRNRRLLFVTLLVLFLFWILYRIAFSLFFEPPSFSTPRRSASANAFPPKAGHIYRRRQAPTGRDDDDVIGGIPRIIHQTWKSHDRLLETFRPWMESCLEKNPDWEYWFWTDDDIRTFIATLYPDYLDLYDEYPLPGHRADMARYQQ